MNYPVMLASDAKRTAIANYNAVVDDTMRVVMKSIQNNAAQGKLTVVCGVPRACYKEVTAMLEEFGYRVHNSTVVPDTEHINLLIDWSA